MLRSSQGSQHAPGPHTTAEWQDPKGPPGAIEHSRSRGNAGTRARTGSGSWEDDSTIQEYFTLNIRLGNRLPCFSGFIGASLSQDISSWPYLFQVGPTGARVPTGCVPAAQPVPVTYSSKSALGLPLNKTLRYTQTSFRFPFTSLCLAPSSSIRTS